MKSGFYISAFICIDELQNLLDIKLRHDQSIALWEYRDKKLKLIRYWELERISGIKQHPKALFNSKYFMKLLSFLLKDEGLELTDIISIWGIKNLEEDQNYRMQFGKEFAFHSIAHLLTAIFFNNSNPFSDCILAMALDSGPDSQFEEDAYERKYYSACVIENGNINFFSVESPARLWSYCSKKFDLREGTLMALGNAMDTQCYVSENSFKKWLKYRFYDEHSRYNAQEVVESVCEYVYSIKKKDIGKLCSCFDERFSNEENRISMIMKIIYQLSLEIVYRNIDFALNRYNLKTEKVTFALSGGFALNCPTNTAILTKYGFKAYQIPPCANDSGIAMGIGIAAFYHLLCDREAIIDIHSAYYGQDVGDIKKVVKEYSPYIIEMRTATIEEITDYIINGNIIVWINGRSEIGPRALGNRSLIADARFIESKDKLNCLKKRQWWRPVAPLIMDEYGDKYFENYIKSPHMLLNLTIRDNKRKDVMAIVHHDGSARIQSVSEDENKEIYALLKSYYNKTGIPILCNTSLNDSGEPIVNRLNEAIEFALHKGVELICVNGEYIIRLKVVKNKMGEPFLLRNREMFFAREQNTHDFINTINPHGLNVKELTTYYDNPKIFKKYSLSSKKCVNLVKLYTNNFEKNINLG